MRRFYPSVLSSCQPFVFLILITISVGSAAQDAAKPAASSSNSTSAAAPAARSQSSPTPAASSSTPSTANASSAKTAGTGAISADNSVVDQDPVTVKTTSDATGKKAVDTDPIFGVPALPNGKTSLVGGTVTKVDGIHNRLTVKVFDGGPWTLAFDERTHFYRDGAETTFEKVKKGDRAYVDTMLDGHRLFARNVHIVTKTGPASAHGQVVGIGNGFMTVRDDLSGRQLDLSYDGQTQVKHDGAAANLDDITTGTLIAVQFVPPQNGARGIAREVTILAAMGQSVTFDGTVRNLDLPNNQLAVENHVDNKTYEIALSGKDAIPSNLMVGSEVTVAAQFDGRGYTANSIKVK